MQSQANNVSVVRYKLGSGFVRRESRGCAVYCLKALKFGCKGMIKIRKDKNEKKEKKMRDEKRAEA